MCALCTWSDDPLRQERARPPLRGIGSIPAISSTRSVEAAPAMRYVRPFSTLSLDEISLFGRKNASFGETIGSPVPLGFILCTSNMRENHNAATKHPAPAAAADRYGNPIERRQ
jgi:hypothetical protein